jgi:hypothetical protein
MSAFVVGWFCYGLQCVWDCGRWGHRPRLTAGYGVFGIVGGGDTAHG